MFSVVCEGVMDLSAFVPRPIVVTDAIGKALDVSFLEAEPADKKFAFQLLSPQESAPLETTVDLVLPFLLHSEENQGMRLATATETCGIISRLPRVSLSAAAFIFILGDEATIINVDDNWGHTRFALISHADRLFLGAVAEEHGKMRAGGKVMDCVLLVREAA
jgi:hypothetical protein